MHRKWVNLSSMKRARRIIIQLIVSASMLLIVLYQVDFDKMSIELKKVGLTVLLVSALMYALGQVVSSFKWWIIARSGGVKSGFVDALKAYFLGMYVNCFGLGTVGGDITRGLLLAGKNNSWSGGVASVFADRAHGLAVLALLAIVAGLITGEYNFMQVTSYSLYLIAFLIVVGWFVGPAALKKVVSPSSKYRDKVEAITKQFPKRVSVVISITVISLLFHLLQIAIHYYVFLSLGCEVPFPTILVAIPVVNIASSLPISWQGIGVRETGYLFFLSSYITSEQAVAMGAVWFLSMVFSSVIGGIIATNNSRLLSEIGKQPSSEGVA